MSSSSDYWNFTYRTEIN